MLANPTALSHLRARVAAAFPAAGALALAVLLAAPVAAQEAGAGAAGSGDAPPAAAKAKKPKPRERILHRQSAVEIPAIVVVDDDRTLPAGTYDISLVSDGVEGGSESFRFEFFEPESQKSLARASEVRITSSTADAVREALGIKGRRRGRTDGTIPEGAGRSERRGQPLIVVRQGGLLKIVYREETSRGTVRLYQASMEARRPADQAAPEPAGSAEPGQAG